jgi:hypothetical protein
MHGFQTVNSPGGTERLVPARNMNSTKVGDVEKMKRTISQDFLEHSVKIQINNSPLLAKYRQNQNYALDQINQSQAGTVPGTGRGRSIRRGV